MLFLVDHFFDLNFYATTEKSGFKSNNWEMNIKPKLRSSVLQQEIYRRLVLDFQGHRPKILA